MRWGEFFTYVVQGLILVAIGCAAVFVGTAIIVAIIRGIKEGNDK